jgi:hypothetical protein
LRLKGKEGYVLSNSHRLRLGSPVSAVYQMLAPYITAISLHAPR